MKNLNEPQEKIAIAEIRRVASLFGIDFTDMTDEELKENIYQGSKEIAKMGVSVEEDSKAMAAVIRSFALPLT